jgi:hypothetical protein
MQSIRSVAAISTNFVRRTSNVTRLSKTMQVIAMLAVIGAYTVLGQRPAVAAACFGGSNLPCGNGDPTQSDCNLSSPTSGTGTCRAYRTVLVNACASTNTGDTIGTLSFALDGAASETWVCTVQANLRITQSSSAGNWTFSTVTLDVMVPPPPAPPVVTTGSFGGSFGPLQLAADASDFRQISGMAWGPQLATQIWGHSGIETRG